MPKQTTQPSTRLHLMIPDPLLDRIVKAVSRGQADSASAYIRQAVRHELVQGSYFGNDPLSQRQLATVIAALRYWQRTAQNLVGHPEDIIATDGGKLAILKSGEIDTLIDKLNGAE
ncbi:MAG: hypothetical protein ABFD89_23750 [Bryobacteraceae bacterium]